jgi:hypothetical protein
MAFDLGLFKSWIGFFIGQKPSINHFGPGYYSDMALAVVLIRESRLCCLNWTKLNLNVMSTAVDAVVAIVAIIGQTKKKLQEAGAVSEESAKTPMELGLDERRLKSSNKAGVMVTKDGRYYLKDGKR